MTSSMAASAKALALFGKRLRSRDYQELSRKQSIAEITSFLKNETYYASEFEGVNEQGIHRGYLEQIIRFTYFERFISLLKYDQDSQSFIRMGVLDVEIQQIILTLYALNDPDRSGQIAQLPLALNKYLDFDLNQLVRAKLIDDVMDVIHASVFYKVLEPFRGRALRDINLLEIEIQLWEVYNTEITRIVKKQFSGAAQKSLIDLFASKYELENVNKIYRLKKYFMANSQEIQRVIHPVYAHISKDVLNRMMEAAYPEEILELLKKTSYGNYIRDRDFIFIENTTQWISYSIHVREMRFARDPNVIVINYMFLLQQEIQNLIDVIEGVRYKASPEKIEVMLIY